MNRKAILIGAPGSEARGNYLNGVSTDMNNLAAFLNSNIGGAWYASEIDSLTNPSKSALRQKINQLSGYDYGIVYFSGHGGISTRDGIHYIEINNNEEEIAVDELTDKANRQITILDTCSSYFTPKMLKAEAVMKAARLDGYSDVERYRQFYEELIKECEWGSILLKAASPGEAAGEDENGGYFTQGMLASGLSVQRDTRNRVYNPLNNAFAEAKTYVESRSRTQTPNMTGSVRRNHWFPFSVKL